MIYRLEMRSTENWSDVRYRDYTSSEKRMKRFKEVPKVQFTDSGHGVVPTVSECGSRKSDKIVGPLSLERHVIEHGGGRN
jgi:hypothetical protein